MVRTDLVRGLVILLGLSAAGVALPEVGPAAAQEDWKPFSQPEPPRRSPRAVPRPPGDPRPILAPMDGSVPRDAGSGPAQAPSQAYAPPPWESRTRDGGAPSAAPVGSSPGMDRVSIEKSELAPIPGAVSLPAPGSGAVSEIWRGLDAGSFEQLVASLQLPPQSHALHQLWRRLITSQDGGLPGDDDARRSLAVRAEALRRSGLIAEEARLLDAAAGESVFLTALAARAKIGAGDTESGCGLIKSVIAQRAALPAPLRVELMLISGYCAGAAKNLAAVSLAADLLREESGDAAFGIALLESVAGGGKSKVVPGKQVSLTEYRLLELAGGADPAQIVERAAPAVLAAIATSAEADPKARVLAAEAAVRFNAITAGQLAEAWRAPQFRAQDIADPVSARIETSLRRAFLFRAVEAERTPFKKTRLIRALLDDARRSGFYLPSLVLMAQQVDTLVPAQEIGWFTETAVEVQLAAGAFDNARRWIAFGDGIAGPGGTAGAGSFQHWLALADVADPRMTGPRGASLQSVEALALRGRFSPDLLHRLATVLDALDYNVPIPLWEAASRTAQPTTGYLPPTGVLSQLQDAAKQNQQGRTALLAMQTLGPHGGEGANMIALGDAIRALKRAKLEPDARRLAFEALLAGWPRAGVN